MRNFILISLSLLVFLGCDSSKKKFKPKVVSITGKTMGTYYSVKIDEINVNKEKIKSEIDALLQSLNSTFSTYIPTSELSKINQQKENVKMKLSVDMDTVLTLSKKMFFETEGAFDPTVGPVVNRWGFGPNKDQTRPTEQEIKQLMANVGVKHFNIKEGYLVKKSPKVYIDLSAVAKGYAVDKVTQFLRVDKGYRNVLVEIGGEVRAHGNKGDSVWAIGVETPSGQLAAGIQKVIPLLNRSIATSGSYRNYLKYGDKVFSHTIDPQTGMPVNHKLVSVTVIHKNCADADAFATALMVMGPKKGLEFAKKKGLLAYFLVKSDTGFNEISTKAFNVYMSAFER
jgi:thiamine biosynthesis lipoprotein